MGKWLQSNEHLTFEVRERVARITLNRPDRRNALSWEMLSELRAALLEADDLRSVSVIVLGGAGPDFCAGYDMKSAYARYAAEGDAALDYRSGSGSFDADVWKLERFQELLRTAFVVHKPVIAKVHGHCVAGGTDLALYCDMVIAADDARIGFPATRAMGSPPNHMWIYNVGPQWAKRLLFSGATLRNASHNPLQRSLERARPQRPRGCWPRCRPARAARGIRAPASTMKVGLDCPPSTCRTLSAPSKAPISRRINASSALVCAASSALAVVNVAVDEFFSLSFNLWLNQ